MTYMNNPYMNMYPQNYQQILPQNYNYNNGNYMIQPPNQQAVNNTINGQMVADFNEIASKNTPLDGSSIYFPLVDGSAIYCKKLNVNTGASQLLTYKLVESNNVNIKDNEITATLSSMHDEIKELKDIVLNNISKYQLPKFDIKKGGD